MITQCPATISDFFVTKLLPLLFLIFRGYFELALEVLIELASDLAQIRIVSFFTLNSNLFESTLENQVRFF